MAKTKLLTELSSSYLYRDILEFEGIRYPRKIRDLLKLLAFQIGQEVSIHELANSLDVNANTVTRYVDLLEKSFVLFRLSAFSRNLRKEVSKKDKIYFYDLGVRNAIIDNFKGISDRNDVGALWENFLIMERVKKTTYASKPMGRYFWRVYTGDEIDYIEEYDGIPHAYEFKYQKRATKPPKGFLESYEGSKYECINREKYLDFIL
jgi:predicted AAA+ superfamily ATPase